MSQTQPPPSFEVRVAERIKTLPPYLFGRINKMKYELRKSGVDVIDLGMGNPTDPTPEAVVQKLCEAVQDPRNHRYSVNTGVAALRREVSAKYKRLYNADLDPESEVIATIGSKEGFSHLCLALLGPGDACVVADPAFPIHIYAPTMAGAQVVQLPLGADDAFLDRVDHLIATHQPKPKLLILNYPHNPTSMTVDLPFWEKAVAICRRHNVMLISDFAYGEVNFDGYRAPSVLEVPGAKDLAVEFTTMSKSYNMAGWRIGFCAGNGEMVKALGTIKGYYDYGIFAPIQISAIIAMRHELEHPREQSAVYAKRRDVVCRGLDKLGWTYEKPRAGMFVWARIKDEHLEGEGTIDFCLRMMTEAEVALSPGFAFGPNGEGYVRIAVVENEQRLRQAMGNLERALIIRKRNIA